MHELAIPQSVVEGVRARLRGARARTLTLEIGRLSGAVPEAVRFCFAIAAEGTELAEARLDIYEPPGQARCRACNNESRLDDLIALCSCGSADVEITGGRELLIRSVEVL